jgi:carbon monoxide dehydrogenase subunit G
MSTLQIEERITVAAPPARVWKFLLDPARVAACLPGAKLDGTEGEDTFLGTMKVKVGPVVMEIKGKATMSHIDPVARKVTLTGTGNDKAGGGSARMDMKSEIVAREDGGSEILVHAEVHLAGKLVRFGRGMMEGISKQLFKQFAERVHGALDDDDDDEEAHEEVAAAPAEAKAPESPEAEKAPPDEAAAEPAKAEKAPPADAEAAAEGQSAKPEKAPPADAEAAAEGQSAKAEEPPPAAPDAISAPPAGEDEPSPAKPDTDLREAAVSASKDDDSPPPEKAPSKADAASSKADAAEAAPPAKSAAPASTSLAPRKKKTKKPVVAADDNAPLDAGSLVWAAIWAWIKGLFARIFGRKG